MKRSFVSAINKYLAENREKGFLLMKKYFQTDKPFLLRTEIGDALDELAEENDWKSILQSPLAEMLYLTQEAALSPPTIYFASRASIGRWDYVSLDQESLEAKIVSISEYLKVKERLVTGSRNGWTLEINTEPFNRSFPKMKESRSIGRGVEFLNRKLSSQLFHDIERGAESLLNFMREHRVKGKQLLLSRSIDDIGEARSGLRKMIARLAALPPATPWSAIADEARSLGFEPGWGATAASVRETMGLLIDTFEAPDHLTLEKFLARIPMIFSIAIISPHGYFGQRNALGLPDTGGQVVYILDQVKALEKEMRRRIMSSGLDIEPKIIVLTRLIPEAPEGTGCDTEIERIDGSQSALIARIPFYDRDGRILERWISRFHIWPYLERFAADASERAVKILGGARPDLIIGNYSDGNLVATLMSRQLGVTQCAIAHALEKTKYLYSDLYWRENEDQYHFACQFTADLIAMNTADFIITSTAQEISGRIDSVGQYESYQSFTMPGLFRVINGIDVFDPKFNIVAPGADAQVYFPFSRENEIDDRLGGKLDELVYGDQSEEARGKLLDRGKPLLFSMARMDRIKNLTGLARAFAESDRLRRSANLLIVGGLINPDHSGDQEEREQIGMMNDLIDRFDLGGEIRWLGARLDKELSGALYRFVARSRGAFAQPALFEAFGLTVIESMTSGLPTFATCFGGPLEIIEHGVSGFHINPNRPDQMAELIAEFFERAREDKTHWESFSDNAISTIEKRYTWDLYAERIMTLSRIYGFWNFTTNLEREEARLYLETLYGLQFKRLADAIRT